MKHLLRVAMLVCVVTFLLSTLSPGTTQAAASSSLWKISQDRFLLNTGVPRVTFPGGYSFNGVAEVSASDVWAVGNYVNKNFQPKKSLIEHWDGTQWRIVKNPNPGSINNSLSDVAAVTTNDVWAVGFFSNTSSSAHTLIEHWNGKQWSVVKSPNPKGSTSNVLGGIAVISASDIWAVGYTSSKTLIEHWDGKQWSIVKSPNPKGSLFSGLVGITAISASDIWAVGSFSNSSNTSQTLTEHWNGSMWSVVTSPSPGSGMVDLTGVAAISAKNVWAVGSTNSASTTLIEHWNGSTWSVVTSPNPGQLNLLDSVGVVSGKNIWAVGQSIGGPNGQVLLAHWNGSTWSGATGPNQPGSTNNFLDGIAVISASNIWAVGGYQDSSLAEHTLAEQWNGSQWSIVPSP